MLGCPSTGTCDEHPRVRLGHRACPGETSLITARGAQRSQDSVPVATEWWKTVIVTLWLEGSRYVNTQGLDLGTGLLRTQLCVSYSLC